MERVIGHPPLATIDDLEVHLGRTLTDAERQQAVQWLVSASASVRRATGQDITYVDEDHEYHDGRSSELLQLNQLPVVEVESVRVEGQALHEGVDYRVNHDTGCLWRAGGWAIANWLGGWWGAWWAWRQGIEVVYSHGFLEVPDELMTLVCGMVGRGLAMPVGDYRSEQLGPYRYDRGPLVGLGAIGLTGSEADIIARYRVRREVIA